MPQQKMRLLRERTPDREEHLGQQQVNIYAGLNAMILLWEFHRYGLTLQPSEKATKVIFVDEKEVVETSYNPFAFHPCTPFVDKSYFDSVKLLQIIGISNCLNINAFVEGIGPFLQHADFREVYLESVYLGGAVLNNSDFSGALLLHASLAGTKFCNARLYDINLSYADLHSSQLVGSNLARANLTSINLYGANLHGANLRGATLCGANVSNTNFQEADLSRAIMSDQTGIIQWNEETNWEGVKGLESAIGVPEALKRQLGLE